METAAVLMGMILDLPGTKNYSFNLLTIVPLREPLQKFAKIQHRRYSTHNPTAENPQKLKRAILVLNSTE